MAQAGMSSSKALGEVRAVRTIPHPMQPFAAGAWARRGGLVCAIAHDACVLSPVVRAPIRLVYVA